MAEEKKEQAPAPAAPENAEAKPKKSLATIGVFGGIMLVEGLAIFFGMKMMGKEPDPTHGMEIGLTPTTQPWEESRELPVAELRVPNTTGARTMLYDVSVVIRVHFDHAEEMEEFLKNRKSTIEDALGRVIRSAEERYLAEPGLETLKRQVRFELSSLMGDEHVIEQVLIPRCMPLATGF